MMKIRDLERYICTLYDTKEQLKRHVFDRADKAFTRGDLDRDRIAGLEDAAERKEGLRRTLAAAMGGVLPSGGPVPAETTAIVEAAGYTVENIVLEPRPGHYATANLYVPHEREERAAAVLFLCGHEYEGKHSPYYHRVCLRLAERGLIVLALDPLGQGERLAFPWSGAVGCGADDLEGLADRQRDDETESNPNGESGRFPVWGTREHQQLGIQCYALGESIARYFLHDAMRAVDYLATRPEVDPQRIGVTGNSGGGTQTALMMVFDDRLAAAAPGTFIMNRRDYMHAGGVQDAEQVWPGLTAAGYDHEDLLLAFAPRPVLVLAAAYDFFPVEATRRTVQRSLRFWTMHGHDGGLRLMEDQSTHRYTDRLAVEAADFFAEVLGKGAGSCSAQGLGTEVLLLERVGGDAVSLPPARLPPLPSGQLLCTRNGQVRLDYPPSQSRSVLEDNRDGVARLKQQRAACGREESRARAVSWLKKTVTEPREACELNPRRVQVGEADGLAADYLLWWSQPGIMNSGYLFRSACSSSDADDLPLIIAVWQGGTGQLATHWTWLKASCAAGNAVLVLNVSGEGPHEPHPLYERPSRAFFGSLHKLADELLWLGDSLAALRSYDVLRSLALADWLQEDRGDVAFYSPDGYAMYVLLASALDRRIRPDLGEKALRSISGWTGAEDYPEEDAMSLVFPGILQVLDLDELTEAEARNKSE